MLKRCYTGKKLDVIKPILVIRTASGKEALEFGLCDSISTALDFKGFHTEERKELTEI